MNQFGTMIGSLHDLEKFRINDTVKIAKPVLKWAGGKGQLLSAISEYYPFDEKITKYVEPFVGGGAVLFDVLGKYDLESVYINDVNNSLIDLYRVISGHVDDLIEKLSILEKEFLSLDDINRKIYYTQKRDRFNQLIVEDTDVVEKSALLVFINRTCFNGLFRVNRKGLFNVPMGAYKKPVICDVKNLYAASEALRGVIIHQGDYRDAGEFIDEKTFVYFDPPYRPLNQTASFTSYSKNEFGDAEQIQLAKFAHQMSQKGAKVLLSNSDPKNVNEEDNFFEDIYQGFRIERVQASRMINSKGSSRGKIHELLISNF